MQNGCQRCRASFRGAECLKEMQSFCWKVQYLSIYPFLTRQSSFSPGKVRNFNKLFPETYGEREGRILKRKIERRK
jgi:hypothetical protein